MAGVRPQFTLEQRVFMVLSYNQTWSQTETIRLFRIEFPNCRIPSRFTIKKNYDKYLIFGVSTNRNAGHSGRPRTARSQINVNMVRRALIANPTMSSRRNNLPHLTQSSFNRITRLTLHFHPYRMERRHSLQANDLPRRTAFCQWLTSRPAHFIRDILIGDEANFPMNGRVNTSTVRHYSPRDQPPVDFTYDLPSSREKLTVWAGIIGDGTLIGPIFINGNVNAQRYLQLIDGTVVPQVLAHARYHQNQNGSISRIWWFQDGAPCHTARVVRQRLQVLFPRRVVGIGHPIEWPARSPDLTPLDFCVWGYIKSKVYTTPPASIADLRRRITAAFVQLRRERVPRRAMGDMRTRAARCLANGGRHVEGRGG